MSQAPSVLQPSSDTYDRDVDDLDALSVFTRFTSWRSDDSTDKPGKASLDEKVFQRPKLDVPQLQSQPIFEDVRQSFTGLVTAVRGDSVWAVLTDITNPDNSDENAEFELGEFDPQDRELIQPGAQFYWHIGYQRGNKLPQMRFSKLRVKRLPVWSEDAFEMAERASKKLQEFFAVD